MGLFLWLIILILTQGGFITSVFADFYCKVWSLQFFLWEISEILRLKCLNKGPDLFKQTFHIGSLEVSYK